MLDPLDTIRDGMAVSSAPIVFYSSGSGNTLRLAQKLSHSAARIPVRQSEPQLLATEPFVLIVPSYADADGKGAVPAAVVRFLNDARNRGFLKGVVGSGNRNFGDMFALGGRRVAEKCQVPLLYRFELAGTSVDIENIDAGVRRFLTTNQMAA